MKERPILFQGAMVRALLDDSKTQTRRVVKTKYEFEVFDNESGHPWPHVAPYCDFLDDQEMRCPYGYPGDRLWVRETFFAYGRWETRYSEKKRRDEWHFIDMTVECDRAYQYAADNPDVPLAKGRSAMPGWWTRPAIFMPRPASRTLLDMAAVRVERLQDISYEDALAEGIERVGQTSYFRRYPGPASTTDCVWTSTASYRSLWESINGADSWAANPWVWAVEFKRVLP